METFKLIGDAVALATNISVFISSGIAIWIFFFRRKEVAAAFRVLVNFSYQTTLAELRGKLDRLNEYTARNPDEVEEIRGILHEIAGQLRGNSKLQKAAPELVGRVEAMAGAKSISEPQKRSLVSEVREILKNLNVDSVENYLGEERE